MMACRVVVGEYCRGRGKFCNCLLIASQQFSTFSYNVVNSEYTLAANAVTPDLRNASKNMLYDSTVGLLGSDTMASPSIYVTYHDAQAYPEYLIAFKTS